MAARLTLRIHEKFSRLTKAEQKIAAVLLENQAHAETHTATELARLAGVSKATAARFFRALGYADFDEARLQAREERNRTQPYAYSVAQSDTFVLGRAIGDHLELELNNLTRTFEELQTDKLAQVVKLIAEAPRVWFLGLGAEEGLARQGRLMLACLRHDVHLLGTHLGSWAEDLAMTGPRDVMVLCTLEPRARVQTAITSYARTTRMHVITLTDHGFMARAQRFSTLVIPCHVAKYGILPTHATMLSMLRLIAIAFAGHVGESSVQRAAVIDRINEELDLFE